MRILDCNQKDAIKYMIHVFDVYIIHCLLHPKHTQISAPYGLKTVVLL